MADAPRGCRPAPYARRRPAQTDLYRIIQHHLDTYLLLARADDWDGHAVRAHVEREPRALGAVLHIFLRVVEAYLRQSTPGASAQAPALLAAPEAQERCKLPRQPGGGAAALGRAPSRLLAPLPSVPFRLCRA